MPYKSTLLPVSRNVRERIIALVRSDSIKGAVYWLFLGVALGRAEWRCVGSGSQLQAEAAG